MKKFLVVWLGVIVAAGSLSIWAQTFAPVSPLTGTVTLSPTSDTTVTSRPVSVTVAGAPPATLECVNGPATFSVASGASVTVVPTGDVSPAGTGPAGVPVTVTAALPANLPPASTVASVTFAASAPTPPPPGPTPTPPVSAPCAADQPMTQPNFFGNQSAVIKDPVQTVIIDTADLTDFKPYKTRSGWTAGPSKRLTEILRAGKAAGVVVDPRDQPFLQRDKLIQAGTKAFTGFRKPANLNQNILDHKAKPSLKLHLRLKSGVTPDPTAKSFSWISNGVLRASHDQAQCGSCWAFSGSTVFSAAYALKYGVIQSPAEQAIVDCDHNNGNSGCQGGNTPFDFLINPGAPCLASLPYTGSDGRCPNLPGVLKASSWGYIDGQTDENTIPTVAQIKTALCKYGPLWVTMDASSNSFAAYSGGVYVGAASPYGLGGINTDHAVTLFGWDDTANSVGAWMVQNSWSTQWGVQGCWLQQYNTSNFGYMAAYVIPN